MINIASVVGVNTCIVILVITQKWKFNISILIMKQTVEKAARTHWSESTYNKDTELAYDERDCIVIKALAKSVALRAFKKGAAWQARQSPWISVEDKAGCDTSGDCIVMVMNGDIFKAYFSSENKWMKSNGGYYDEVIDDVVAWFPIPSFDDILEANKDVLERLKRKEIEYEDIWNN